MSRLFNFLRRPGMMLCATSSVYLSTYDKNEIFKHPVGTMCFSVIFGAIAEIIIKEFTLPVQHPFITGWFLVIALVNVVQMNTRVKELACKE